MVVRAIGRRLRDIDFVLPGLLERAMLHSATLPGESKITLPLVAIVGPPRVGSTLMYQLLVAHYQFFYLDNLQHALLRYPYLAFKLSSRLIPNGAVSYESDHGFVEGMGGLSEGAFFWPFWFDMALTQNEPKPSLSRSQYIRRVLDRIYSQVEKPMVSANNAHAFYLGELDHRFEKLVIVNMRRAPVANAVSLLRARRKLCKSSREWWSMRPKSCLTLDGADPYHQIVCQIVETYREVREQRLLIPHVPFVDVHYEELCRSPREILDRIAEICGTASIPLIPRSRTEALPSLRARGPRECEQKDVERFRMLFESTRWQGLWSQ